MTQGLVTASYIGATILFILTLGGLSHQETSRRGNLFGIIGMTIAVLATIFGPAITGNYWLIIIAMLIGGSIGLVLASKVLMTQMPELVAILHSLVGMAAVLVGFVNFMDDSISLTGAEKTIHEVETYIGILIGAVTFSGSVIAFGKLSGKITSKPLLLPARHWLNLGLLLLTVWLGDAFLDQAQHGGGTLPLLAMTIIALAFGVHMVMAIGGADMPVVISMLNSYSGWAFLASEGDFASLMPPPLPRPPACTCAFTTTTDVPSFFAADSASAEVSARMPSGTATPNSRSSAFA